MKKIMKFSKRFIPEKIISIYRFFYEIKSVYKRTRSLITRDCSICGYEGNFRNAGKPPRIDAKCPSCGSLERHRLFWLWFDSNMSTIREPILHFAPEKILEQKLRGKFINYKTADLFSLADIRLNIEKIELPDESVSTVICNHVFEHVNDNAALKEINRVLADDGLLITSVPIIEGWKSTYEDSTVISANDREIHFGQNDHVRFYGQDFRNRVIEAGFESVDEYTAEGDKVIKYGLMRGEKLFIYRKIY